MESVFLKLVNMSFSAGWLVLAVVALRFLFKKAPKWLHCLLWGLVAVRLVCPFSVESALSLLPTAEPVPGELLSAPSSVEVNGAELLEYVTGNPVYWDLGVQDGQLIYTEYSAPDGAFVNPMRVLAYVAALLWLVGMAAMTGYALVSTWRLRRRVGESLPLRAGVRLCDGIATPFILGVFRPCIYLPSGLSEEQQAYVLAHEEAHLRRRDHLWKPLGWLLLTVYWFNPLLWLAYILLCRDIELACDEKVVRDMDTHRRKCYSEALLACSAPRRLVSACPLAFGETGVKQRIKSVLHYKKPAFWLLIVTAVAGVSVAVCFLTSPPADKTDEALDELIVDTVQAQYASTREEQACPTVAYTVFGTETKGNAVTVYGMVLYQEYTLNEAKTLQKGTGSHCAFALTAEKKADAYTLVEYWTPKDGTEYTPSIREKFPWQYRLRATATDRYYPRHEATCIETARQYFGLDYAEVDWENYVLYEGTGNPLRFYLEKEGNRCYFQSSLSSAWPYRGTYTYSSASKRLVLTLEEMKLTFTRQEDVYRFVALESDALPGYAGYSMPDGSVFAVSAGSTTSGTDGGKTTTTVVQPSTTLFIGTVQKVDKQERCLLLNSQEFNGQVWVALDETMPLYRKGDELFVVYNGWAATSDPPRVGAMRIGLRESLSFRIEYYADRVAETAVEKTATVRKVDGLEERAAELQVVLASTKWVSDALLDRTTLYFDGFVTLSDGKTLYFDLQDGHLYDKAEGRLATLSAEGKELLGRFKPSASTGVSTSTTTSGSPNAANPFWGASTRPGNPTTAPNRTPNAKGVVNIVDWTTIYTIGGDTMIETFYVDDTYAYQFPCAKSQYIFVYYADGSSRMLKDALTAGDVTLEDMEDFGILFTKERRITTTSRSTVTPTSLNVSNYFIGVPTHPGNPTTAPSRMPNDKGVVNIVDWTTVYVPMYPMDELFYEDDTYTYHFSYWVWVYYADGSILFIQDALAAGDVTPEDLEDYGIAFTKKRKGVTTASPTTQKTRYY